MGAGGGPETGIQLGVALPLASSSRLPLINKDIRRDIVKLNACTRDFAGDIFTHESTTCSMGEGNSVRG